MRIFLSFTNSTDRDETSEITHATNNVLPQVTVNFYANFDSWICAVGNPYAIYGEIAVIILLVNGTSAAMPDEQKGLW